MEKFIIMRCVMEMAHDSLTVVLTCTATYLRELLAGMDLARSVKEQQPELFALDVFHSHSAVIHTEEIWDDTEWTEDTPEILEVAMARPADPPLDLLSILFQPDEVVYTAHRKDEPLTLQTPELTRPVIVAMLKRLGSQDSAVLTFADLELGEEFNFGSDVVGTYLAGTWVKCTKRGYRSADPQRDFIREIGNESCQVYRSQASAS